MGAVVRFEKDLRTQPRRALCATRMAVICVVCRKKVFCVLPLEKQRRLYYTATRRMPAPRRRKTQTGGNRRPFRDDFARDG